VERVVQHGGLVSYKHVVGGAQVPYELNINYFDALSSPDAGEAIQTQIDRFMAAQAITLALVGVPGIYVHSLFGSRSWHAGVELTGRNRTINRQKFDLQALERELSEESSLRHEVFYRYSQLLSARSASAAFHPHGEQAVLDAGEAVFALLRRSPDGAQQVFCLQNISNQTAQVPVGLQGMNGKSLHQLTDLITGRGSHNLQQGNLVLAPYETLWLR
ncbi:MAG: sugar phosphorylase, partial [Chloroflexota bacterium]|nr:sugar phosphorylase [Chloroflexota bacterium]